MISKVLIVVSAVLILAGFIGVKMKAIRKKLLFAWISSIGMMILSFAQMNAFGVLGSSYQVLFRLVSLILLTVLLLAIIKKNAIDKVEGLSGIGKNMPYIYAMTVIFSMMVIGIPGTGTFLGLYYSELGLIAMIVQDFGIFAYIGALVNVIGIGVLAALLFPMLRQAYFPGAEMERVKNTVKPGKGLLIISVIVLILLVAASVYPNPIMMLITNLFAKIYS